MKSLFSPIFLGCCVSSLIACTEITTPLNTLDNSYQQAVSDAAMVRKNKISTDLIAIDDKNPALIWNADKSKILVVTWKEQAAYEKFIKPNHASPSNPDYAI